MRQVGNSSAKPKRQTIPDKKPLAVPVLLGLLLPVLFSGCSLENRDKPGEFDPYWAVIWDGDIYLTADHEIGALNTLVIRPGTRVHFAGESGRIILAVFGGLDIQGQAGDKVRFLNDNGLTNEIHYLAIAQFTQHDCAYADFGDNKFVAEKDISMENCRIGRMEAYNFTAVSLRSCVVGQLICYQNSSLSARNCDFDTASFPSLSSGGLNLVFDGLSAATVRQCNFWGCSTRPLSTGYVVEDFTSGVLDLTQNYWRTINAGYISSTLVFNDTFGTLQTTMPASYPY